MQKLTVTDGRNTIEIPFEEDFGLLTVLQRRIAIASPCNGRGFCGMCKVEIQKPDGSLKPELACFLKAKDGMVVHVPLIREIR